MRITEKVETPVPPPKRVILDLSEEEAGFLYYIADYYAEAAGPAVAPATGRLATSVKQYKDKSKYPHTDCFKVE